ncbi:DJ-1/PfpI family protein [Gracilimonas sp.]|uniref:DJ-1/PfpI family protein n=1 Tax=Gracilimonas sp. TaxID=1974203 RepID=UPI0032EADBAF
MKQYFCPFILFITSLLYSSPLSAQDQILIVVTNNAEVQVTIDGRDSTIAGGYTLSEVTQAYDVFIKSGFTVDFMSPHGGKTQYEPEEKLSELDKAFIDNAEIMDQLKNTLSPNQVNASEYNAIYFAGGKTLWDFPNSSELATLTSSIYEQGGVIGAICHGPAALLNVRLSNGDRLIEGKYISSFTNLEEQLFSKAAEFYPFMLQDELTRLGAKFQEAPPLFDQSVVDGRLVTGQNPLSTYSVAEDMMELMGKTPPQRPWDQVSFTVGIVQNRIQGSKNDVYKFIDSHGSDSLLDERLLSELSIYGSRGYMGAEVQNQGIQLLEIASELIPDNPQILEELARYHYKNGDINKAEQYLTESLKIDPDSETANELKNEMEQ